MGGYIIRKILIVLIIIAPVISDTGCKKQKRCGCGKDVLFTLESTQATVYYNESKTSITFNTLDDPYSTYNFCNPGEMAPKLEDVNSGDVLLVSGDVFWDCTYLYQNSNYSYQTYYKVYMIQVTDLRSNLYGKK
jgi:hypothetical protein